MTRSDAHGAPDTETRYRNAMDTAVRLLTGRRHTRRELARKLAARNFDAETVAAVMAACERFGYVDDPGTAVFYVEELKIKGYGLRYARSAMHRKGFDGDLVEDSLARHYPPDEESAAAVRMALKKRKTLTGDATSRGMKEKVYRYLHSRGFSTGAVHAAMTDVFGSGR